MKTKKNQNYLKQELNYQKKIATKEVNVTMY